MGLFGSISTTITGISSAFKNLITRPFVTFHQENTLKAIVLGSVIFVKDSLWYISGSFGSIFDTLRNGVGVLVTYGKRDKEFVDLVMDRDLFEDDIELAQKGISAFSTPLTAIDTQNRIWLKILMREKQSFDDKKRIILRDQTIKSESTDAASGGEAGLGDSRLNKGSSATCQYILDNKHA